MSKSTNNLDKTSEYYRVCPYCRAEFMAEHMSREYCDEDCGNKFNNRKKRLNRTKMNMVSQEIVSLENNSINSERNFGDQISRNIYILHQLSIDPDFGSIVSYDYLVSIGFNFNYINNRIPVKPNLNKFKIEIGPFSISRYKYNLAHIETIKTNKK
jgi:ribosomal protein S27AE